MNFYTDIITHAPRAHTTSIISDLDLFESISGRLEKEVFSETKTQIVEIVVFETHRHKTAGYAFHAGCYKVKKGRDILL